MIRTPNPLSPNELGLFLKVVPGGRGRFARLGNAGANTVVQPYSLEHSQFMQGNVQMTSLVHLHHCNLSSSARSSPRSSAACCVLQSGSEFSVALSAFHSFVQGGNGSGAFITAIVHKEITGFEDSDKAFLVRPV